MTDTKTAPQKQATAIAENTQFDLTIAWEKIANAYDQELKHAASHLKLAGFRPGKVPSAVAEKQLDQEQLVMRVLQKVVPSELEKRFQEEGDKYHPISQPSVQPVSTLKGTDWKVTISFAQPPVIKLGDYQKTIAAAKKEAKKELDNQVKSTEDKKDVTPISEEQQKEAQLRTIFKSLVEQIKPAIPELLVREETEYRLHNLAHSLQEFKIELQDYLKKRGISVEELISQFQAEALAALQLEFILSEIGKTAKIEVKDEDRQKAVAEIKDEKLKAQYQSDKTYQDRLDNTLYRRKIIDHILSI